MPTATHIHRRHETPRIQYFFPDSFGRAILFPTAGDAGAGRAAAERLWEGAPGEAAAPQGMLRTLNSAVIPNRGSSRPRRSRAEGI